MWNYAAKVLKVVDADTLDLECDLGFRVKLGIRLRLMGINAPELNTKEGHIAREYVEHICPPGTAVIIRSEKERKSFDRYVAQVTLPDGTDLAQRIREAGLGE
jgi:micrococcal nuclease